MVELLLIAGIFIAVLFLAFIVAHFSTLPLNKKGIIINPDPVSMELELAF